MQCSHGHPVDATASFCPTCGIAIVRYAPPTAPAPVASYPQTPAPPPAPLVPMTPPSPAPVPFPTQQLQPYAPPVAAPATRSLYTAAAIVNWVVLGLVIAGSGGIGIIAAAWFVPMTIRMHKNAKGPYKHTGLGVCTLLFCNLLSGILLLVDDSGRPPKPLR